ncbi:hypothetical protein [Corynebacterium sp. CCUG 61414]|uniref:hypothetical protein n=1 Tax=Corynebacterium sp. CCUG 61414 TaxID=2823896 RepID=UPI00210D590C|nr:hypothetical protein [Corynebacterium sp. CCUG 61414]
MPHIVHHRRGGVVVRRGARGFGLALGGFRVGFARFLVPVEVLKDCDAGRQKSARPGENARPAPLGFNLGGETGGQSDKQSFDNRQKLQSVVGGL